MAAISLAILGKDNVPVYMKEFADPDARSYEDDLSDHELFGLSSSYPAANLSKSGGSTCTSRHQFILHAALDRFEQLAGPPPGYGWRKTPTATIGNDGMFVGLLAPSGSLRVYGTSVGHR